MRLIRETSVPLKLALVDLADLMEEHRCGLSRIVGAAVVDKSVILTHVRTPSLRISLLASLR